MTRLLVVDDDPAWRALYRMAFEQRFEITEATDAEQALAIVDRLTPDVILLDLRMPKIDGLGLIQRLKLRGVRVPLVVCSGALAEGERLAIPGVQITRKTPDLKELRAALRAIVPECELVAAIGAESDAEESYWRD
jgi:DNA-binding response OmpR family regulator